jgi:hypothetical protein
VLLRTDVRLWMMTAIVLVLTVTGIGIFWLFSEQNLDLIDAVYFTVTIMTTTGFGDIHLRNAPPPLQLYGVALMLSGTAALAILFALITDALISARLARVIGAAIPRSPSALAAPAFAAAAAGEHVLATIAVGSEVLAVVRLQVAPGCRVQGHIVAELEAASGSRILLLDGADGPTWRPPGATRLAAGDELVANFPRGELGRVLAWTERTVPTAGNPRP